MEYDFEGKRVLIVDDDPDIIDALRATFAETKATVDIARDGNAAVSLSEKNSPDLVVLDIMLPQKSGFLVLERLRQDKAPTEKPHVIMITGNQGRRHRQYAEALGVHAYLNKPFPMEKLLDHASKLLVDDDGEGADG